MALLTAGLDKAYTYGLATALAEAGVQVEIAGGDGNASREYGEPRGILFLNFRRHRAGRMGRLIALAGYYARLAAYSARRGPRVLHVLWNGRWETFDRTMLMLYHRLLGKTVVLTAHNVNAAVRDGGDSWWNRLTLRIQYRLAGHIFVHTTEMRRELASDFGVPEGKVTVIRYGLNNLLPNTGLTPADARTRLGLGPADRVILFFGNIRPYKGLEYLVTAFAQLAGGDQHYRLLIAGACTPGNEAYWESAQKAIGAAGLAARVIARAEEIPDAEAEVYFKAADVVALPYTHVYQSGVLFTGFAFGLPAVVTDVGALRNEIREGEDGFVCPPRDPAALAGAIERYFASGLHRDLGWRREEIGAKTRREHSWASVAMRTIAVYWECERRAGL